MLRSAIRSASSATVKSASGHLDVGNAEWKRKLSKVQFEVLREARTEPRAVTMAKGGFDDHFVPNGEYLCAACDSPLYKSAMKFDCGCGWPGFWTNIPGAVAERADEDGRRVEISCSACNSHLGHVFRGEGFSNPEPNERHCVNSVSLQFKDASGKITKCTYSGQVY